MRRRTSTPNCLKLLVIFNFFETLFYSLLLLKVHKSKGCLANGSHKLRMGISGGERKLARTSRGKPKKKGAVDNEFNILLESRNAWSWRAPSDRFHTSEY